MKLSDLTESKKLSQAELDNAFDNYDDMSEEDFHTSFIEYFDDYFTDDQVDSGEMDEFIGDQWERFQKRRG